jgi:hypothetical protein
MNANNSCLRAVSPGALHRLVIGFILAQLLFVWLPTVAAITPTVRPKAEARSGDIARPFRRLTQPSFTTCGQTSVAMIAGVDVRSVIQSMGTNRATNAGQLIDALRQLRPQVMPKVTQLHGSDPRVDSIVYLTDTSFGGGHHWTVFRGGKYYDPTFGKLGQYPSWVRKQFAISVN